MTYPPHTRYYLGFNLVPRIGPIRLRNLVERCGSIEAAWQEASAKDLEAAGVDKKARDKFFEKRDTIDLDAEMERLEAKGITIITQDDSDYPRLLLETPAPPPMLYIRGRFDERDSLAVAVVGTRFPSSYGKQVTHMLVPELAASGVTIVSGFAMGIDSLAHRAALDAGGRTIGIFGCGVDVIYPNRNQAMVAEMIEQGALVSELPLGTEPHAINFPPRNRIICGMSLVTLVVEAGEKSGALITAKYAGEYGRDVFAIPGSILSGKSVGPHQLIHKGARLVTCAQDILDELQLEQVAVQQEMIAELPEDPTEATLLSHLSAEPIYIDDLCRASGMTAAEVSAYLSLLSLKGYVYEPLPSWWCTLRPTR